MRKVILTIEVDETTGETFLSGLPHDEVQTFLESFGNKPVTFRMTDENRSPVSILLTFARAIESTVMNNKLRNMLTEALLSMQGGTEEKIH